MKKIFTLFAVLMMSACTTNINHLSTIIPVGVNISESNLKNSILRKDISGEDTNYIFLFFPLGQPSFDTAVSNMLNKGQGQIITNATIIDRSRWFLLFGYNQIEITGDVIDLQ